MRRTQRSTTNDQDSRGEEPLLSFRTNSIEENLPAVTIVHCESV